MTPEPFKHHAPIEKVQSKQDPDPDEDGEVKENIAKNKQLEEVLDNESSKTDAVHAPLVHRKGNKQYRKVNTETEENQNENDMEEDNLEEDSDNNESESDEIEDNE